MNTQDYASRVEYALAHIGAGGIAIVVDDFDRENEGDFVAISDLVDHETINFMATHGRGLICQSITRGRADELELPDMTRRNTDANGTAFTVSVDHARTTTGISAYERAQTVRTLVDANTVSADLVRPGHIFPLVSRDGGVFSRRGHTEASLDLARLAGSPPSGVICEIMNDDGSMARLSELERVAEQHNLPILSVEDVVRYRDAIGDMHVAEHSRSTLPTAYGRFDVSTYTSDDPASGEIVVMESISTAARSDGAPAAERRDATRRTETAGGKAPLVRIHSECLTGEAFGSLRCDCGPQLETALERIGEEGGALVYLKQEGRGIGILEKIRAYALQDEGMDTVEANLALGHEADGRRFGSAAGIEVTRREDLTVGRTDENAHYLTTKIEKFGHAIQGV